MVASAGFIRVIVPAGLSIDVTITTGTDASVTAYTTQNGSSAHASPATITVDTDFHLRSTGQFHVVCAFNGATVDDRIVSVSSYGAGPAVVAPVLDVDELATATSSGASDRYGAFIPILDPVGYGYPYGVVLIASLAKATVASLYFTVAADSLVMDGWRFRPPNDAGADVTIQYFEATVTNVAGTVVLSRSTVGEAGIVVPPGPSGPGTDHDFTLAELSVVQVNTGGGDLTMNADGSVHTTAGGIFAAQIYIQIA